MSILLLKKAQRLPPLESEPLADRSFYCRDRQLSLDHKGEVLHRSGSAAPRCWTRHTDVKFETTDDE